MIQTKLFKSNQSQAVRLPKAVAFPDDIKEVSVIAVGSTRVITPIEQSWDAWFDCETATTEFLQDREQPAPQERQSIDG